MGTRDDNPLYGPTPCKENPDLFSSPLLDSFDSVAFTEDHPELKGKSLKTALDMAEASHNALHEEAVKAAVDMCRDCPALVECGKWVLAFEPEHGPVYGVVGGMEPHQRKRVRRRIERLKKAQAEERRAKAEQRKQEAAQAVAQ